MKKSLTAELLKKIMIQKNQLINLYPELTHFFIDIYFPHEDLGTNTSIPFLPIRCFRDFNLNPLPSSCFQATFLSSGSTNEKRAKHSFSKKGLAVYCEQSCLGFAQFLSRHNLPLDIPILSLIPPKEIWQQNSLAAMISMFKENGFNIHYCDIEKNEKNIVEYLNKETFQSETVIFGTTFHHLFVASYAEKLNISKMFKGTKLAIIDTGGTKGRTQSITLAESKELFYKSYGSPAEFLFLSEYGMCELGSQAWSIQNLHDGTFVCNQTLLPVSLDLKNNLLLKEGEEGFAGFIDLVNLESWPAIITEDIATVISKKDRIFKLTGRSPDASLKGCSLNVKKNFFFEAAFPAGKGWSPKIHQTELSTWGPLSQEDLEISLSSWNKVKVKNPDKLTGQNILIISSANIPVTWLYPARIAALLGAKSVHIKLPSLRNDDPISHSVRLKIEELIAKIAPSLAPTKIILETSMTLQRNAENDYDNFSKVIVFGTDETIETFKEKFTATKTCLIPQGNIQNSYTVNLAQSPKETAELCSLWLGRGCLTPVCLFMNDFTFEQKNNWIQEFHAWFEKNISARYKEEKIFENISEKYMHAHNILYIKSLLKCSRLDPDNIVLSKQTTYVVNLTHLDIHSSFLHKIDFTIAGSGFIYILDASTKHLFPQLASHNVTPTLSDKHAGKTWEDWLTLPY